MTPYQRELDRRASLPGLRTMEAEQHGEFLVRKDPYHEATVIGAITARKLAEEFERRRRSTLLTRYLMTFADQPAI